MAVITKVSGIEEREIMPCAVSRSALKVFNMRKASMISPARQEKTHIRYDLVRQFSVVD